MLIDIEKIRKSVGIIGESDQIKEMLSLIGHVATTDISVLVTGESGSGKEMVARAVHKNSKRKFESLIIVNCAAIPSGIIESELFGHKKGAFTGANENRQGYFEAANKGTIFLDEIGELPVATQAKLLRVIEQGEFIRVGDTKTQTTDVRIIAATNKDLQKGIIENALSFFKCDLKDIMTWMAPCISAQNYQVGEDVYASFISSDNKSISSFKPTERKDKWLFSLTNECTRRLERFNIKVIANKFCTFRDKEFFYSFRREQSLERMVTLVWRNNE